MKAWAVRSTVAAIVAAFGLLLLAGTALAGLAVAPAKNIDLNGEWLLNTPLSDDPAKISAQLHEKLRERMKHYRRPVDPNELDIRDVAGPRRELPEALTEVLSPPKRLTLIQSGGGLAIQSDKRSRRYEAGVKSVVSFGSGVADQNTGWKGQTFVIAIRSPEGEKKEERYSLDKAGRLLVFKEIDSEGLPGVKIRCVYDRAGGSP